jgi:hypothetical protein
MYSLTDPDYLERLNYPLHNNKGQLFSSLNLDIYWLACISHLWSEDVTLTRAILVGTHLDRPGKCVSDEVIWQLRNNYKFVKEQIEVSCNPDKQINVTTLMTKLVAMSETG